jgi:hypothetical protein
MTARPTDVRDIEVVVRDEHEQPVPGASLVLSRDGQEWLSESAVPANVVGITDVAGRARLRDVPHGDCFVAAVKVPIGASAFRAVSDRGSVELALAACDTEVRGRVVDHHDRGVAGVEVVLVEGGATTCWFVLHRPVPKSLAVRRRTVSDADGRFVFRASRSWGGCFVEPSFGRLRSIPYIVEIGGDSDLRFEAPGRALVRGVVRDWRGEPVSRCEVWVGEPEYVNLGFDESTGSLVSADTAGRFEVPLSQGGRYVAVPLGTATLPSGRPTQLDVVEDVPATIELRTAESANIEGNLIGTRNQRTRIVAKPTRDDGHTREITLNGDGDFVLHGLMRGVQYEVIAYQDRAEIAREWSSEAGDARRMVLRSERAGTCILSCRLGGEGIQRIAGKPARLTVQPIGDREREEPRLEQAVTAVEWRGESELRFDDLPRVQEAVAILIVDDVELARSKSFRLHKEPAVAEIEVPADGALELLPSHARTDWCVWVRHADGSEILGRERAWLDPGVPFRCALPAGDYVLQFGYEGDRERRRSQCTVLAGQTLVLRMPGS